MLPAPLSDAVALLLPGMTLNATVFPELGMPAIGVDFTKWVVGPDGSSAELQARRMECYVEQLVRRLERELLWLRARRRIVVAHSFGGFLALAWQAGGAGGELARVDGLVLAGTSAGPLFQAVRLRLVGGESWALRIPVTGLMRLWNHPRVTRAISRLAVPSGRLEEVDFRRLRRRSDFALGLAGWRNTDWRARRSYRFAMEGFDVRDQLHRITVPAIVLHGPRDSFFPLAAARELADRLPRGELRIVPGAAHGLPLTHPEAVVQAAHELLRRAAADPPPATP